MTRASLRTCSLTLPRIRRHLQSRFRRTMALDTNAAFDAYHSRWESHWVEGVAPHEKWDQAKAAPALVKLLDGDLSVKGKSVLVPGCGRGYDLIEFAQRGAERAVGMEISSTAAAEARKYLSTFTSKLQVQPEVVEGDWLGSASCMEQFDMGYDYTFFCALHPDMRKAWAEGWAKRLKKGGCLITLMFPVEEAGRVGPPWPVQPQDYAGVLKPLGFECVKQERVSVDDAGRRDRINLEILAIWTKS